MQPGTLPLMCRSNPTADLLPEHDDTAVSCPRATSLPLASVVGADADGDPGMAPVDCRTFQVTRPTVVVFGSEGRGLRTNVRKARKPWGAYSRACRFSLGVISVLFNSGVMVCGLTACSGDPVFCKRRSGDLFSLYCLRPSLRHLRCARASSASPRPGPAAPPLRRLTTPPLRRPHRACWSG